MLRIQTFLLFLLCCSASPMAQAKPSPLEALLKRLEALPRASWDTEIARLRKQMQRVAKHALELRQEATRLERQSAKLRSEIARLEAMRKLVGGSSAQPAKSKKKKPKKKTRSAKPVPQKKPPAKPKKLSAARLVNFDTHVFPILEEHCVVCHDDGESSGGLDLSTFDALVAGGGSGKTLVVGNPDASRLFRLVARTEKPFMPKDADPLTASQIALLRRWIENGAPENAKSAPAAYRRMAAARPRLATTGAAASSRSGPAPMPTAWPRVARVTGVRAPPLRAMASSPTAPLVAVAGVGQVLVLATPKLALAGVLRFEPGTVEVVQFSADGKLLLVAGGTAGTHGAAQIYDVVTGKLVARIGAERDTVLAAALSPDKELVALGGPGKLLRVYDVRTGKRLRQQKHRDWILSVAFSPDGAMLAVGDRAGAVRVIDARSGRSIQDLAGHRGGVHAVTFRPDGKALITAGADGTLRAWQLSTGKQIANRRAHANGALALAWSPNATLLSAGGDGIARLWRADLRPIGAVATEREWIYSVAFGQQGRVVFAGDWRGRLQVCDTKTRKRLRIFVPARAPRS